LERSLKPIEEKLKDLKHKGLSREEMLSILYVEKYSIFEITEALSITSNEFQMLSQKLNLYKSRCPQGHKFIDDSALRAADAYYCSKCMRWFDEATLKDEIELEIRRLKEKEKREN